MYQCRVSEQGDEGDAFYVLIEGTASVIRTEPPAEGEVEPTPKILAQLSSGSYFGERALLKNETRFASVKVTSEKAVAMSISRAEFEARKFHELVPDKYK